MLIFKELIYNGVRSGEIPARTKSSREWYRETARQSFSEIQPGESSDKFRPGNVVKQFSEKRRVARPELGMMYSFKYDPKFKKTLPYYDTFPLIFPVEQYNDGILGINFHYLPLAGRAKLMDALYTVSSDKRYNERTKILATYDILKGASKFSGFQPTLKRYLYEHVKTPFLEITAAEWDIALFLPMERFKKAQSSEVWADAAKKSKRKGR